MTKPKFTFGNDTIAKENYLRHVWAFNALAGRMILAESTLREGSYMVDEQSAKAMRTAADAIRGIRKNMRRDDRIFEKWRVK